MSLPCGCTPLWLSSVSQPVTAEHAAAGPCPCCGAGDGCACLGGTAGWLPETRDGRRAWVDVCPVRLQGQQLTL